MLVTVCLARHHNPAVSTNYDDQDTRMKCVSCVGDCLSGLDKLFNNNDSKNHTLSRRAFQKIIKSHLIRIVVCENSQLKIPCSSDPPVQKIMSPPFLFSRLGILFKNFIFVGGWVKRRISGCTPEYKYMKSDET